jgi:hypothetical protein
MEKQYKVIHPIRHDGKPHGRGAFITLSDEDGKRLQNFGHVEPVATKVSASVEASEPIDFESFTKKQLIEYGISMSLTLDERSSKAELIEAITAASAKV